MLSYEQIKELVELVSRHRLTSVELERSGFRLRIEGSSAGPESRPAGAGAATGAPAAGESRPEPAPSSGAAVTVGEAAAASAALHDAHVLTSPIVGTYYGAPAPDAEPFARVGDRIHKGQVLCIVEAMKLMNEIESDVDGVVLQIFPSNAQPVEFGEPLLAIRAD